MASDHIIVGSSPLCLIEALWLSHSGKTVRILEGSGSLGGAWKTIDVPPFGPIEIGCHIWDVDREVDAFLKSYLGIELEHMSPQPKIYHGNKIIPYDWKNNVFLMKRTLRHTLRFRFRQIAKDHGPGSIFRFSVIPMKYSYPKQGSKVLLDKIIEKINADKRISVHLNHRVNEVRIKDNRAHALLEDGEMVADQITLTQHTNIPRFVINDKVHEPKLQEREFCHVHLALADELNSTFSYLRVINDKFIHRLSDVTGQVDSQENRIILAGIHAHAFHSNDEETISKYVLSWLKNMNLSSKTAFIKGIQFNSYRFRYMDPPTLSVLNQAKYINVLRSVNFIHSMKYRLGDWTKMIPEQITGKSD